MAVVNNTVLGQRLFPKKKPLAAPNISLDQFSGKAGPPPVQAAIPEGTQTGDVTTITGFGNDPVVPVTTGVQGAPPPGKDGGVTVVPPPPPIAALPELPEFVSPGDFRFEQSITPDLQEIKQFEALTGREISAQAIEGLTKGQLEEASRNAMQARQLNIQQANIENQQLLDKFYGGLALHGASLEEQQFYFDNLAPDEDEALEQDEINLITKDVNDSSIDYSTITQNPNISTAEKDILIEQLNSDTQFLVDQLKEQGIEIDWEPYALTGEPTAGAGTTGDQPAGGQPGAEQGAQPASGIAVIPESLKRASGGDNENWWIGKDGSVIIYRAFGNQFIGEDGTPIQFDPDFYEHASVGADGRLYIDSQFT